MCCILQIALCFYVAFILATIFVNTKASLQFSVYQGYGGKALDFDSSAVQVFVHDWGEMSRRATVKTC